MHVHKVHKKNTVQCVPGWISYFTKQTRSVVGIVFSFHFLFLPSSSSSSQIGVLFGVLAFLAGKNNNNSNDDTLQAGKARRKRQPLCELSQYTKKVVKYFALLCSTAFYKTTTTGVSFKFSVEKQEEKKGRRNTIAI